MGMSKAKQAEVAVRRIKAIGMRTSGARWDDIAQALGYDSRASAYNDVSRALEANRAELALSVDALREQELERLDLLQRKATNELESESEGTVLAAIDRLIKISESRRKLLGLDAPIRHEVEAQVLYAVEGVDMNGLM